MTGAGRPGRASLSEAAGSTKPPFDAWWLARTALVTVSSAAFALVSAWIVGWRYRAVEHCDGAQRDSVPACWPSWAEDPGAHVIVWAFGVGLFLALWAPVWVPFVSKLRRWLAPPQRP